MPTSADKPRIIRKAALAYFRDKKILMARDYNNRDAFYTPGGGIEAGETPLECVQRETKEELGVDLDMDSVVFLGEFEAAAHRKTGARVNISLFTGKLKGDPRPTNEIVELRYFDSSVDPKHLTPISIE